MSSSVPPDSSESNALRLLALYAAMPNFFFLFFFFVARVTAGFHLEPSQGPCISACTQRNALYKVQIPRDQIRMWTQIWIFI